MGLDISGVDSAEAAAPPWQLAGPAMAQHRENLALKPYLDCIKATLNAALCTENFASQIVERHNKPEIEVGNSRELLLNPVTIHRSEHESVMIETAINSVRVSIKVKQLDELDTILASKFSRFLMQRADNFVILCTARRFEPSAFMLPWHARVWTDRDACVPSRQCRRRKPMPGFDVSFLLTNFNLEAMWKHKLIDFVIQFMEEIDSEISSMKIQVSERARTVGYQFLKEFTT